MGRIQGNTTQLLSRTTVVGPIAEGYLGRTTLKSKIYGFGVGKVTAHKTSWKGGVNVY